MQNALNRINEIRKEACDEGIKDPRRGKEGRYLTASDYVPIRWSSDLEYIARIRAAEASVGNIITGHTRLNGTSCWSLSSPNGIKSQGEVLAWNISRKFLQGIEQWYGEKTDWTGNTGKETGHYTQMIDPDNIYVGLATFVSSNVKYSTTTAGEYSSQKNLDESAGPAIDNCIQTVEINKSNVTASITDFKNPLAASTSVQTELKLTAYGSKMEIRDPVGWASSDINTATVDSAGKVIGIHERTADITACVERVSRELLEVKYREL